MPGTYSLLESVQLLSTAVEEPLEAQHDHPSGMYIVLPLLFPEPEVSINP